MTQHYYSLEEYFALERTSQDEPRVTRYARLESEAWERRDVTDLDASLELASIGCALRLRDIYDGVTFPA